MLPRIKNRAAARATSAASGFGNPGGAGTGGGASVGGYGPSATVGAPPRPFLPGPPGIPGRDAFGPINPLAPIGPFAFPPGAAPPVAPPAALPAAPPANPFNNPLNFPQLVPVAVRPNIPLSGTENIRRLGLGIAEAVLASWNDPRALTGIAILLSTAIERYRTSESSPQTVTALSLALQEVRARLLALGAPVELVG